MALQLRASTAPFSKPSATQVVMTAAREHVHVMHGDNHRGFCRRPLEERRLIDELGRPVKVDYIVRWQLFRFTAAIFGTIIRESLPGSGLGQYCFEIMPPKNTPKTSLKPSRGGEGLNLPIVGNLVFNQHPRFDSRAQQRLMLAISGNRRAADPVGSIKVENFHQADAETRLMRLGCRVARFHDLNRPGISAVASLSVLVVEVRSPQIA